MLTLTINERDITMSNRQTFRKGTVGAKCKIVFTDFWSKYNKTIVFKPTSKFIGGPFVVYATNMEIEVTIPWEVMSEVGSFRIGVYGTADGEVLPTLWSEYNEVEDATDTSGEAPQDPSPSVYQQILELTTEAVNISNSVREDADAGKFKGNKGDKGDPGKDAITDQTYNPESENAQSGIAVAEAVSSCVPNNIKDSVGSSSLQQVQDTGYTGIAIITKNPNAYVLDNTLTDNEPIGATGAFASSFGGVTSAQGKRSFAEGTNTIAKGKYSHAEGDNSVALGNDSHTEGLNCVSFGSGSHSEGGSTQAIGMHAHSEGVNTIARGDASHAGGSGSIANGIHSFAHGNNVIAGYNNQFVVGMFNKNREDSIFEVGWGSNDTYRATCFYINHHNGAAYSSYSLGYNLSDSNRYATQSEVSQAITVEVPINSGRATNNSVVFRYGYNSSALYDGCVSLGIKTTASGVASAAFNSNTQAIGNDSNAIGRQTIASGIASHSQGYATQAKGDNSHSEGDNTIAEGDNSHAEGVGSYAKGAHSHTQGNNTQALAENSSAAGNRTIAGYANQFVVGTFNSNKSDTYFEVGNGSNNDNRSTAFAVCTDGSIRIGNTKITEAQLQKLLALIN